MKVDWKGAFLVAAFCVAGAIATSAQTFTPVFKTLANFDTTNGAHPQWAPLVQGLDGAFYGTTAGGGLHESGCFRSPDDDCGVIYRITSDGTFSTLYEFTNGIDGSGPGLRPDSRHRRKPLRLQLGWRRSPCLWSDRLWRDLQDHIFRHIHHVV
jgi:hypothetical protein